MDNIFQENTSWTFVVPCEIPEDVKELIIPGEEAVCAYKTLRDVAIFTNKRLIVRDAQGVTGKKIEMYTLPYSSIIMYSTENGRKFLDANSEIELWTKAGKIKINLDKKVNIREIDRLLAMHIL